MKKEVITYNPKQVASIVNFLNKHLQSGYKELKKNKDEQIYLILIHDDLFNNIKNTDEFFDKYIELMKEWDMPYTFFPYYTYFNKVMNETGKGKPNPRVELKLKEKDKTVNIVNQICHGCIILNVNKLNSINFTFDTNYPTLYYLQDMVQKCFDKNLWISNCWFIDRFNSWQDLKECNNNGFIIDGKKFNEQRQKYQKNKFEYHNIQFFISKIKQKFGIK